MKYTTMNDKAFAAAVALYTSDAANMVADDFFQFAIESCLRYVEHGEVSHLNNLADAAKRMRSVTVVRKMITQVACHSLGVNGKYLGKANGKKLSTRRKNVVKITRELESIVKAAADVRTTKSQPKEYDTTAQLKTVKNTVARLIKAELSDDEIIAMVRKQLTEVRDNAVSPVSNVSSIKGTAKAA